MALGRAVILKFHFRKATPAAGSRQGPGSEEGAVMTSQQFSDKGCAKLLGMERKGGEIGD